MENVVNFEQTKDHAKEIIYFNDGRMAAKNESTIYVVIKNVFIICIIAILVLSLLFGESIFFRDINSYVGMHLYCCWIFDKKWWT